MCHFVLSFLLCLLNFFPLSTHSSYKQISPETLKARQMIKMKNFEEEMKTNKIKRLRPLCVGLYWGSGGRFEDGDDGEELRDCEGRKLNGDSNGEEEVADEGNGGAKDGGEGVAKAKMNGRKVEVIGENGGHNEEVVRRRFKRLLFTENQVHHMSDFFHEFQVCSISLHFYIHF